MLHGDRDLFSLIHSRLSFAFWCQQTVAGNLFLGPESRVVLGLSTLPSDFHNHHRCVVSAGFVEGLIEEALGGRNISKARGRVFEKTTD